MNGRMEKDVTGHTRNWEQTHTQTQRKNVSRFNSLPWGGGTRAHQQVSRFHKIQLRATDPCRQR